MTENEEERLSPFEARMADAVADVLASGHTAIILEGVGLIVEVDYR